MDCPKLGQCDLAAGHISDTWLTKLWRRGKKYNSWIYFSKKKHFKENKFCPKKSYMVYTPHCDLHFKTNFINFYFLNWQLGLLLGWNAAKPHGLYEVRMGVQSMGNLPYLRGAKNIPQHPWNGFMLRCYLVLIYFEFFVLTGLLVEWFSEFPEDPKIPFI